MPQEMDVIVENCGSMKVVQPMNARAWEWVNANVQYEQWQVTGGGIAVEPGMVDDMVEGMRGANLAVQA